jgi:hypothetical protein
MNSRVFTVLITRQRRMNCMNLLALRQMAAVRGIPVVEVPSRSLTLMDLMGLPVDPIPTGGAAVCPYCDEPGGTESVGTDMLHRHCYFALGNDLALLTGDHPDDQRR